MFSRKFVIISYRISSKSNFITQKKICHRSLHVVSPKLTKNFIVNSAQKYQFYAPILNVTFTRHKSEFNTQNLSPSNPLKTNTLSNTEQTENIKIEIPLTVDSEPIENVMNIPEPPILMQPELENIIGEPSLHSLGLGSWYPSGLIQQFLELLHVHAHMPWWATIVITTVCVRLLMFPLSVRLQKHSAKMHNIQPELQYLQQKLTEARKIGDQLKVYQLANELKILMSQAGTNPSQALLLPLIQAPVFLSFYYGLRGMVHLPVESLKYGGLWWFENLTVPDKYYLLPFLTSTTLSLTIELGADSMSIQTLGMIRYFLRSLPIIMFPFIINFEGAILCYWLTTNIFSLIQVNILKIPAVRTYFKIPKIEIHDKKKLVLTKKKFSEGLRDSWINIKMARELNSRQIYDEFVFEKAGKGPVPKTYKVNPLRSGSPSPILSKKEN